MGGCADPLSQVLCIGQRGAQAHYTDGGAFCNLFADGAHPRHDHLHHTINADVTHYRLPACSRPPCRRHSMSAAPHLLAWWQLGTQQLPQAKVPQRTKQLPQVFTGICTPLQMPEPETCSDMCNWLGCLRRRKCTAQQFDSSTQYITVQYNPFSTVQLFTCESPSIYSKQPCLLHALGQTEAWQSAYVTT